MKKFYLSFLTLVALMPSALFSQALSTTHSVYDTMWKSGVVEYYLELTTVAVEGKSTLTAVIKAANATLDAVNDVDIYYTYNGRIDKRIRCLRAAKLPANGILTFEDTFAHYDASQVGSGAYPTGTPKYYSVKINRTTELGGGVSGARTIPTVYLPDAPRDVVTVKTDTSAQSIVASVYPNVGSDSTLLKLEFTNVKYYQDALAAALALPLQPAGGKPVYFSDMYINNADTTLGREKIPSSSVFWGNENVAYTKFLIADSLKSADSISYIYFSGGRPGDATIESIPVNFNKPLSNDATLASITPSAGTLDPVFDAATTRYSVSVPAGTTEVPILSAVATDDGIATIEINDVTAFDEIATIEVTAEDGTTKTYDVLMLVPEASGLQNTTLSGVSIYPNPSNGILTVKLDKNIQAINIIDLTGKIILSKTSGMTNSVSLDISNQPKGIYFIQVQAEGQSTFKKIVIE